MTTRAVAKEKFGEQVVSGISCKYCRLPTSIQMAENMNNLPDRKPNQKWLKIAFTFGVSLFFFFFFFFFNGVFLLRLRCSSDDRKRVRRACDTVLCDSVVTRRNVKGEGECFIFHRGSGSPINAFKNLFKGGLKIFMK